MPDHRVEQRAEPFLGVHDLVDAAEQLLQQRVEPHPRQGRELQRTLVPRTRLLPVPAAHLHTVRNLEDIGNDSGH